MSGSLLRLEARHLDAVMDLVHRQPRYMGIDKRDFHESLRRHLPPEKTERDFHAQYRRHLERRYLSVAAPFQLYGYLESGQVMSCLGMRFLATPKCWVLTRLLKHPARSIPASGLGALFEHCIRYAEALGCAEYYTCVPQKTALAHDKLWSRHVPSRSRYAVETVAAVPANARPDLEFHFELMDRVPLPFALVLRKHSAAPDLCWN